MRSSVTAAGVFIILALSFSSSWAQQAVSPAVVPVTSAPLSTSPVPAPAVSTTNNIAPLNISVSVSGTAKDGDPEMGILVDGQLKASNPVSAHYDKKEWQSLSFSLPQQKAAQLVAVAFLNGGDAVPNGRTLYVQSVTVNGTALSPAQGLYQGSTDLKPSAGLEALPKRGVLVWNVTNLTNAPVPSAPTSPAASAAPVLPPVPVAPPPVANTSSMPPDVGGEEMSPDELPMGLPESDTTPIPLDPTEGVIEPQESAPNYPIDGRDYLPPEAQ